MLTIAGEAGRDVGSNATNSAVVVLVVFLAASAGGAWWITRRRGSTHGSVAWFAALGSLAGIVALTLARHGPPGRFRPSDALAWSTTGWDRLSGSDLLGSSQFLLNVALFVPAGVAWTWVTGRPARTLAGLVGLTVLVESVQGVTGAGGADITDVAANTLGAAVGVGVAAILTRHHRSAGSAIDMAAQARRRAVVGAGLVVVTAVLVTVAYVGADRRQARIHDELERAFAGTSYDEIAAVLRIDPTAPEPGGGARFADSEQVFGAISVRADGLRFTDERIEMRWPALFFGLRRCVLVTWTPSAVEVRDVSGGACTEFLG